MVHLDWLRLSVQGRPMVVCAFCFRGRRYPLLIRVHDSRCQIYTWHFSFSISAPKDTDLWLFLAAAPADTLTLALDFTADFRY